MFIVNNNVLNKLRRSAVNLFTICFCSKSRQCLISKANKEELHKYITSLVNARKAKMLAINCMPDHLHFFVGFKPSVLISDFVKQVKVKSNEFIKAKKWSKGTFSWQEGYGDFSYGHSQIDRVCRYVMNQELHHKKKTFKEEYLDFLNKFSISYEAKYLFEWIK